MRSIKGVSRGMYWSGRGLSRVRVSDTCEDLTSSILSCSVVVVVLIPLRAGFSFPFLPF